MRRLIALAFVAFTLGASSAQAGWTSLGAMPKPERDGDGLLFRNEQGVVSVRALAPDIVRVRFAPGQAFGRDHSYAVVNRALGAPGATVEVGATESVLRTAALRVTLKHDPFRIAVADAAGNVLDEDDPERGIAFAGKQVKVWKRLRPEEFVYGLGEKNGRLNKRGPHLGGGTYVMWTTDAYDYGDDTDPLYVSIPFYMVLREGRAHGIFLDNTFRSVFDVGHESPDRLAFGAEDGELDYYVIHGPAPKRVIERYTALTGRMSLPPRWSLGYHQCRYSYYPESKVRFIADNFRGRRIPADVIWLDIHYLEGYNPFTWDKERFPNPKRMIADLRQQGFRLVTIVDPHPKKQPGWWVYDSGLAGDHFVKNPDGSVYEAPVWPSNAAKNPGPSVFPDFSKPAARKWWGSLFKFYTDDGVAGIWNDMNEPAVFVDPFHTMALEARHDNEGKPTDTREIHNVYGLLNTQGTYEGLLALRPNERPFVLTRATFAGGQRYAAVWPGDNQADWDHLRATLPMLMGMGLSGLSFVGSDIGGFAKAPTAELLTRWLQAGVFYPFMRMHTEVGSPDQEPWSYGHRLEAVNRRAIELRYELLPHVYNVMREASETGVPAMRPLMLEYPTDPKALAIHDQFLFGSDLLVAPVLREEVAERSVYLPAGDWYDFWTGRRLAGGGDPVRVPVTIESIPLYVRAGAFIFRQPVVQHTGEMPGQPLIVDVYPSATSEARLYEDDGESRQYLKGSFLSRRFTQRRREGATSIEVSAAEGSWRPKGRELRLRILAEAAPRKVLLGGEALPSVTPEELQERPTGWARTPQGFVVVRLEDRFDALRVTLEP
ncbi:MAG TPA: TIM-barrel domain-containing protein [Vicinamibacteria bacterium]|nr:TIM-barrel domain-containing protein [Vicinamibacteria bacterium]